MAANVHEFFGYPTDSVAPEARWYTVNEQCPFVEGPCVKHIQRDGVRRISGVCSIRSGGSVAPVITCPQRMYAGHYQILKDVSQIAFGAPLDLVSSDRVSESAPGGEFVAVFGQKWGRELRLPKRQGRGSYFVDWILARLSPTFDLFDFTAVEVQTIDTTGNYREEFRALAEQRDFVGKSTASPNRENVNKRILPQIIYKGHVLRREPKCSKGLFLSHQRRSTNASASVSGEISFAGAIK